MKYKSNNNSNINDEKSNNEITTFNLKIKDIRILLDDINPKKSNFIYNNKRKSNTIKILYKKNLPKVYSFSARNYNKNYYNKRNNNSLKYTYKTVSNIPINLKTINCCNNNIRPPQILSTSINFDLYNNSHLTRNISKLNHVSQINTDRIIYSNKRKKSFDNYTIETNSNKNKKRNIYIKKTGNKNIYFKTFHKSNIIKPFILTSNSPKNYINNNNNDYYYISNKNKNLIKKKKIKFIYDSNNECINKDKIKNNNKNYLLYIKSCIIIQNWWRNKKKRLIIINDNIIIIQKIIRGYLLRKRLNLDIKNLIIKIPKYNIHKYYYISKSYYNNYIAKVILLQREIRTFLIKKKLYQSFHLQKSNNFDFSFLYQKPRISICYLSKYMNKNNNNNISFINKKIKFIAKISKLISKDKDYNKIIIKNTYLNNSPNSFINNISGKKNIITIQTIDSKESHDFFNHDISNKKKIDNINQINLNINMNNNSFYFFQNFFKNNIIHKFYIILLKMKYNYINFYNFIKAIFNAINKYNKRKFFQYLSFFCNTGNNNSKNRGNLLNIILRHINIYKKNNYIKNEVIQLIEKILLPKNKNINLNNLNLNNKIISNISSKQENELINTKLFENNDRNLINYICLFYKYEKYKKYIDYNFIQNRLIKEPLKYRNIFTITRYIDNLDNKINNNKICMKCFCKKNEKKCILNCNCHYFQNIINGNCFNNLLLKNKPRKGSLKKYKDINNDKENKVNNIIKLGKNIINKNIYNLEKYDNEKITNEECQNSECINISNISGNYQINKMNIKKAFEYFSKL